MTEDVSWRTQTFRQSIVQKIEEAIRQSGMSTSRNSIEMENQVFQKAKTKEEYLSFVARLILHVREMNSKKGAGMQGQPQGPGGVQDPINALQNLASQGTRNNQMLSMGNQPNPLGGNPQIAASNLLQAMNRGPGQNMGPGMNQSMANMQNAMGPRMGSNGGAMANQMAGQMANQMATQMSNQMGNQMAGQMSQMAQMGGQMPNQMQNPNMSQISAQMGAQMQGSLGNQLQGPPQNQMGGQMGGQLSAQMGMNSPMQNAMGGPMANQLLGFPRNPTPTQFLQQSPSSSVQSPAGLSGPPPSNQMVASPALAASPGSSMSMLGSQPRSIGMAPSPGASINTPGQPIQSPMGGMQDEQAYREKIRQLSKYIDPLRKMIARMGTDGEHVEKLSKMKKLLEILSNPQQRMPLETLLKCEVVLEKLDFKRSDGSVPPATSNITFKEHHIFTPLLEAINNCSHSPVFNHTLHRTFGPTLDALFGPELKLVPPLPKQKIEEPTSDIPDVLQGEIARLDQKFKISLDPNHQPGAKSIHLMCWLDDKNLPCVPPISLIVPEDYPITPPKCQTASQEYNATQFLSAVEKALLARIQKLPKFFSLSQVLDTWEMSVRQASSPNPIPVFPDHLF